MATFTTLGLVGTLTLLTTGRFVHLVEDHLSLTLANSLVSVKFNKDHASGLAHAQIDAVSLQSFADQRNLLRSGFV